MKTGLLLFEQFQGKKDLGSSRIRGHWIVKHWKDIGFDIGDAEIYRYGAKYDAVIYQKAYFVEHAKEFKGIKIFDLCDPDWLHWSFRTKEMLNEVDAVTCSSQALVDTIKKFTEKPVYFIPDRVDLAAMPEVKVHTGPAKKVAWFGYSHNFPILDSTIKALAKRGLSLVVVSDGVYAKPPAFTLEVQNFPFSSHYLQDIQTADIVLNPNFNKGKWRFKSDNKTFIAWALGIPVARTDKELDKFLGGEARQAEANVRRKEVEDQWDICFSVAEYKNIIAEIAKKKIL